MIEPGVAVMVGDRVMQACRCFERHLPAYGVVDEPGEIERARKQLTAYPAAAHLGGVTVALKQVQVSFHGWAKPHLDENIEVGSGSSDLVDGLERLLFVLVIDRQGRLH